MIMLLRQGSPGSGGSGVVGPKGEPGEPVGLRLPQYNNAIYVCETIFESIFNTTPPVDGSFNMHSLLRDVQVLMDDREPRFVACSVLTFTLKCLLLNC